MKSLSLVVCVFLVAAAVRADSAEEVQAYMELVKEHVEPCAKEHGVALDKVGDSKDSVSLEGEERKNFGCFQACLMQKKGVMEGTVINADKIKTDILSAIVTDPAEVDARMKNVESCLTEVKDQTDQCEVAFSFLVCTMQKSA